MAKGISNMRTTLNIDDDVLMAVKAIAGRSADSAGAVASNLIRRALAMRATESAPDSNVRHGFRPFGSRGDVVTNELIDRLREEAGD